jgi:hypothetical protein
VKIETAIEKILSRKDISPSLKRLKLQNLALRCYPSSINQKTAIAAYKALEVRG